MCYTSKCKYKSKCKSVCSMTTSYQMFDVTVEHLLILRPKAVLNNQVPISEYIYHQIKCHGVMFLKLSEWCRMPRELVFMALYSVQKCSPVNGIVFHDWRIILGGINCVLHEPITCSVRFYIFNQKYAGVQAGMSILG